jgi:peptidoglycan/xylan/chitin deacetylase (PgdA/CDA1 family)
MDPDSATADKYFSMFSYSLNPLPFLTSTISCSVLLISCHSSPDEKLVKTITEKIDSARSKPVISTTASHKKKIYLTFDDGPNKGTNNVMEILKDEQVPATFFLIGEQIYGSKAQEATWDSLQNCSYIERCNHSYTHAHNHFEKYYSDASAVVTDFRRCNDSLQLNNQFARTPGRNIWRLKNLTVTDLDKTKAAADSVQQAGFSLVGWDVEWHFTPPNLLLKESAETMMQRLDSMLAKNETRNKDHIVLLAHDQTFADSKDSTSLRTLIHLIKERPDYEMVKISGYPGLE